jgi:hypothetical protein
MIRFLLEITTQDETINVSSSCRDPLNPSDIRYPDLLGNRVAYPVRLEIPSINQKISDAISGTTILNQYTVNLINDDGLYDDLDKRKIFGADAVLKRSDVENPRLEDFDIISTGKVVYPVISKERVTLYIDSTYRSLTEQVCRVFTTGDYPNLPESAIDKNIPIGYGPGLKKVPLTQIDSTDLTKYIALDPDYIIDVDAVYDQDGNSISFTGPDVNGVVTATDAVTADVSGLLNNSIGEIISYELEQKSGITYDSDNWDTAEAGIYIATSGKLNYYVTGGTVRNFVDGALKSDNAFLFTKNNGKLTFRQWGTAYNIWTISNKMITQFDKKDYKDSEKYFSSSVRLAFDKDISTGKYNNQYIDATQESAIEALYGRTQRTSFNVDLYEQPAIEDLASRLVDRFGTMSPNCRIGVGVPTSQVNLLDIVKLPVNINNRVYTEDSFWVVRESNPGQDILYLEALSGYEEPNMVDGVLCMPLSEEINSGILSEPMSEERDGVFSQPGSVLT